jgi:Protein of unknown function (DUF1161)
MTNYRNPKPLFLALVLLCASVSSMGATCEALRDEIETKIKSAGVTRFTVTVVDTAANAPGKVVGTCERGAKKIVYARPAEEAAPAQAAAAKPAPVAKRPNAPMITECADGSVATDGGCKKK